MNEITYLTIMTATAPQRMTFGLELEQFIMFIVFVPVTKFLPRSMVVLLS